MLQKKNIYTVGFAKTVTLLILALLFLVLGASAYFLSKNNQTNSPQSPTPIRTIQNTSHETSSDHLIYSNTKQNFKFTYPSDWVVRITAEEENYITGVVSSPSNLSVAFLVGPPGVGGRCEVNPNADQGHEQIKVFNSDLYLHYYGDKKNNTISYAYIIKDNFQCPNIAFFTIPDTFQTPDGMSLEKLASFKVTHATSNLKVSDFKSSEFQVAKEIIKSFSLLSSQK